MTGYLLLALLYPLVGFIAYWCGRAAQLAEDSEVHCGNCAAKLGPHDGTNWYWAAGQYLYQCVHCRVTQKVPPAVPRWALHEEGFDWCNSPTCEWPRHKVELSALVSRVCPWGQSPAHGPMENERSA